MSDKSQQRCVQFSLVTFFGRQQKRKSELASLCLGLVLSRALTVAGGHRARSLRDGRKVPFVTVGFSQTQLWTQTFGQLGAEALWLQCVTDCRAGVVEDRRKMQRRNRGRSKSRKALGRDDREQLCLCILSILFFLSAMCPLGH